MSILLGNGIELKKSDFLIVFFFSNFKKKTSRRRFLGVGRVTGDKQLFFLGLTHMSQDVPNSKKWL